MHGWYSDRELKVDPLLNGPALVSLAAFEDYDKTSADHTVVLKVGKTYFLQYNLAEKFNIEVQYWHRGNEKQSYHHRKAVRGVRVARRD
jgi:hypothetical protein